MKRKSKLLVGDFETTVYEGQDHTEVWASAIVEMYTEDVHIFNSLPDTFKYLVSLNENIILYYHNLKFDGSFWIDYLMYGLNFKQAIMHHSSAEYDIDMMKKTQMPADSYTYSISDMGQWYSITIRTHSHFIEIRDSLKLLPFSVKRIGESFQTKHKKLDMEYEGYRYAGCEITDKEKEYIANDVLVVKEALEIMYTQGHTQMTIGSCCLAEYRNILGTDLYNTYFPNLLDMSIDQEQYGSKTAWDYIHKSYKGGWCYVVKGKENQVKYNGTTADVNSLYPSMMSSESGNKYPVGYPSFWKGDIPDIVKHDNVYYFVRIRTRFFLKKNKLPCIQIKNNPLYSSTEWLETSNIHNIHDGKYYSRYIDTYGNVQDAKVELTLTMTDFALIQEHYELKELEILDGCYFFSEIGIFDEYINKYKKIKLESKGAIRELAKLFLNNLYGKMAASPDSSFKYALKDEDEVVHFMDIIQYAKTPGFIAVGSAITSYARNFTIRAAQMNYYGVHNRGFIYADTDSIHCDLAPQDIKGIKVHAKNFCCWKLESCWDYGLFVRQKTYLEHVVAEDLKPIDTPYYSVKCAGMPENCKQLFIASMEKLNEEEWKERDEKWWNDLTEEEKKFVTVPRDFTDFAEGLLVPGKLMPKRIKGGIILVESDYELRGKKGHAIRFNGEELELVNEEE